MCTVRLLILLGRLIGEIWLTASSSIPCSFDACHTCLKHTAFEMPRCTIRHVSVCRVHTCGKATYRYNIHVHKRTQIGACCMQRTRAQSKTHLLHTHSTDLYTCLYTCLHMSTHLYTCLHPGLHTHLSTCLKHNVSTHRHTLRCKRPALGRQRRMQLDTGLRVDASWHE